MNGKEILADTNILLYLLKGDDTIAGWLQNKKVFISFITELELLGYDKITAKEEVQIKELLRDCHLIALNNEIKEIYIHLKRRYSLKLADCIIAASAIFLNIPLITADKQISSAEELEVLLYEKG